MITSEFADKTVLLVGATSGVGLATAKMFAARGARRIAIVGRSAARGEPARVSVGPDTLFIAADANHADQAQRIVKTTEEAFGPIDALVTATAGHAIPKLFKQTPIEEMASILHEQAIGPIHMASAVLPSMRARKRGAIVSIASDAAKIATPGETIIGAAMAAITMFSRALAMECKRDNIRVNVATPSLVEGTQVYDRMMDDPFCTALFGKAAERAMLGVAQPDDLAALIVFLCSDAASKLTGQAISVNGGISAA